MLEHRLAPHRQQRLRPVPRQRIEPRRVARGQDDGLHASGIGGLDETSTEPPGRAARPEAASSAAPVPFLYERSLRPCLETIIAPPATSDVPPSPPTCL